MAVNRFGGSFKVRTDILDNITPNVVVQPNVSVPAGEWKPVPWLPVEWQGEASKDGFVISAGKVVSLTADGLLIPSGLRLTAAGLSDDELVVLTYTATDVELNVQDVTTGVAVTAAKTVNATELASALMSRGLLAEGDFMAQGTSYVADNVAHVGAALLHYISAPVGVCAYDVYTWGGNPQDGDQAFTNYNKQHLVQFLTDVQLQVPIHTSTTTATQTETLNGISTTDADSGLAFPDADSNNGNPAYITNGILITLTRYSSLANKGNLVGFALPSAASGAADGEGPAGSIAANTDRTPVTFNANALATFLRERSSAAKLVRAGDWFWDNDAKVLLLFMATAGANPVTGTVTYSVYGAGAAAAHRHVHASGTLKPGDFVTYDTQSNFVPVTIVSAGIPAFSDGDTANNQLCEVVGRCLAVHKQPKGLLDRVRTAWEGSSFAKDAQMPGTATKGFTDLITLSGETVADAVAIINVKC